MPSLISGNANRDRSVATRMSADSASSSPTPKQYPSTAAITGLGLRAGAVTFCPRSVKSTGSTSMNPAMSPPDVKCSPSPRITTTCTAWFGSISRNRSSMICRVSMVMTL
jgi:hypothetical protein